MRSLSIIILICLVSCKPLSNYEKQLKAYKTYSSLERSESLWDITYSPWAWNHSFERVEEIFKYDVDIEYINTSKSSKATPFLNAAGALACLRNMGARRPGELDSMEVEAVKIVTYLVSKGANVRALTFDKRSALHLAAQGGREKMIPILVELGLDINRKDSTMVASTPLIMAITAGDLPTVKAVVNAGADINLCSAKDNTPLDWATNLANANNEKYRYHDQKAIAEYLKSLGAKKGKNDFKNWLQF